MRGWVWLILVKILFWMQDTFVCIVFGLAFVVRQRRISRRKKSCGGMFPLLTLSLSQRLPRGSVFNLSGPCDIKGQYMKLDVLVGSCYSEY